MTHCRVFVVGLAYGALFPLLSSLSCLLYTPCLPALMLPVIHGVVVAWYAVRDGTPGSRLGYLGALLLGSVIVDLESVTGIAARETDLPAFISVLVYYALSIPAYAAGHLAFRRLGQGNTSSRGKPYSEASRYCTTAALLLGFAAAYTVAAAEAIPVLIGPVNIGPPEHAQRLALASQAASYGLLAAYTAVTVAATLTAKLRLPEAVETILAALYPMTLVHLGYAIWWSAWGEQAETWPQTILLHALAPTATLTTAHLLRKPKRR